MDTERDHFASITTPSGSVVTFPFLTGPQADDIAHQYGPPAEPIPRPDAAAAEEQDCRKCDGQGYWYETVTVTSPEGSKVITQKRVNCRPCGGTGKIPK
jgi:hypothetical protein